MLKKTVATFVLCLIGINSYALQSFKSANEVLNTKAKFIECAFVDINGNLKSVTIPSNMLEGAIGDGLKFDGSSVPGCSIITDSDMHLTLDLDACITLPEALRTHKTIMIMCDIGLSETECYDGCTRTILKRSAKKLNELGLKLHVGSELEFYLINKNGESLDTHGYFDSSIDITTENLKQEVLDALVQSGIPVEKIHHEVGPAQYEVTFRYKADVVSADTIIFTKYIIKSIAKKHNLIATFMPKPIKGENGSGMHIHYSLYDTDQKRNIFYSENNENNLSGRAQSFLAGNLKHMLEISPLLNSCINSYKRLIPGYEAPIYLCWGIKNRSALIRIPMINAHQQSAVRAELRCPDPSCNPYLAFAAIIASGMKGIMEKLIISNPVAGNLYNLNQDQIKRIGIRSLPSSLEKALVHFSNSLFVEEFLGKKLVEVFTDIKTKEVKSFYDRNHPQFNRTNITDWEIEKYL